MRGLVEKTRRDLTLLHRRSTEPNPLELAERDEEALALARKYFDKGYRLMDKL